MDLKATAEVPMSAMWVTAPWVPVGPDGQPDTADDITTWPNTEGN